MGTKTTEQQHKLTSPAWLLNWFSQLTTNTNTKLQQQQTQQQQQKEQPFILPWKKDAHHKKAPPSSSIVITEPISVPNNNKNEKNIDTIHSGGSIKTIRNDNKDKRPSITISLTPSKREERRNSQQTNYSSSSDQSLSFLDKIQSRRRDTNSSSLDRSSVLSDLWSKAAQQSSKKVSNDKRHNSSGSVSIASSAATQHRTRFHWPLHYHHHQKATVDETFLRPSSSTSIIPLYHQHQDGDSSLASSYRGQQQTLRHLKRHSISSSLINSTTDNTPSGSRPNSILLSQPESPNLTAIHPTTGHLAAVDAWYLNNQQHDEYCCQHKVNKKTRWEIKHELTKLAVDGLFSIPEMVTQAASVEKHILQIGCGEASAWGIEVASQYPKFTVICLDDDPFSSLISNTKTLPKNFSHLACDELIQGLINLPNNSFDFISSRFLILEYTLDQYQQLVTECTRICKAGGFIEIMEMDLRIYHQRTLSNSVTQLLNSEVIKVLESKQLDPRLARKLHQVIVNETSVASFQIKYISLPLGVWGGKLGVMFRDDVHALITSFQGDVATLKEKACRSEDELEYKMDQMDTELDSNRAFMNLHVMVICV